MWHSISTSAFMVLGASTIAYIAYRRCSPTPHAAKRRDVVYDHLYSRSCATNACTPPYRHQDWTVWQLHTSISIYLNTTNQLTAKQQQHLLFICWLVKSGRLTEWIIDTTQKVEA
jgi:hypothetical protein